MTLEGKLAAGLSWQKTRKKDVKRIASASGCMIWWICIWAASWQNQQNGMCAQRRLRSAWASAQSDHSLRCPYEESLGPKLPIQRTAKTLIRLGGCPGWSESSLGAQSFCWFCHEAAHITYEYCSSYGLWVINLTWRVNTRADVDRQMNGMNR